MIIHENTKLLQRKNFLLVALENKNITQEKYDSEVPELERQITINLNKRLQEAKEEMQAEVQTIKKTVISDGNFKRAIAKIIIRFLKESITDDDVKGVMRQGYKLMRLK